MGQPDWESIKRRILEDPVIRRELMAALARQRGEEVDLKDPPGWIEDALTNFVKILIEMMKDLATGIFDAAETTFYPLAETVIRDLFELLETPEKPSYESAVARAARWLGMSAGVNATMVFISFLSQVLPGVSITALNRLVDWWYWGLGMGFMGWQIIAPLTRATLLDPLDRYYRRRYRPRHMTAGLARAAYRDGVLTKDQLVDALQDEGIDDDDIEAIVALEDVRRARRIPHARVLPPATLGRLYRYDAISRDVFVQGLQAYGLSPGMIDAYVRAEDIRKEERMWSSPELPREVRALKAEIDFLQEWIGQMKRYLEIPEVEKRIAKLEARITRQKERIAELTDRLAVAPPDEVPKLEVRRDLEQRKLERYQERLEKVKGLLEYPALLEEIEDMLEDREEAAVGLMLKHIPETIEEYQRRYGLHIEAVRKATRDLLAPAPEEFKREPIEEWSEDVAETVKEQAKKVRPLIAEPKVFPLKLDPRLIPAIPAIRADIVPMLKPKAPVVKPTPWNVPITIEHMPELLSILLRMPGLLELPPGVSPRKFRVGDLLRKRRVPPEALYRLGQALRKRRRR